MTDTEDYHAEVQRLRRELTELRAGTGGRHLQAVEPVKPRRLTLSDVLEHLLAAQSKHGGDRSMVRLTRNARHETQIEVVVRSGDTASVQTVEECSAEAVRIYDALRMLYPAAPGGPTDGGKA